MDINEMVEVLKRLYPDWSREKCIDLVGRVYNSKYGKFVDDFERLDWKEQDDFINLLIAIREG